MSDQEKVVKFKKRKNINIGVVIFSILFIYIVINVYLYFTKEQLTIYEVQEGSTAVNNRITGLILRQEKLISSKQPGYVLYYQKNGARVAKDESVYSVTENEIYNQDSTDGETFELSAQNDSEIQREIKTFQISYSNDDFSKVYDFKDNAQSTVLDIINNSLVRNEKDTSLTGSIVKSKQSGMITYYMDNYETVSPSNITSDLFDKKNYNKTSLRTIEKISSNTPIYKIITSEEWNLVLPITVEQYQKLKGKTQVSITVIEDNLNITANLQLSTMSSGYYAILTMNKDMANYIGERYLDIEINFDSADGLKIPNSSIVKKNFYKVPLSYFTYGGESKDIGLTKVVYGKNGNITYPFTATDIYYKDKYYGYIDTRQFTAGAEIQLPTVSAFPDTANTATKDKYTLSETKKLIGAYNVNLGYAVFKRIEILYKDKEYSIIKDNTENGLSTYDHIVLDGKTAVEQKIIY